MPYISKDDRDGLESQYVFGHAPTNPGQLNYLFTMICKDYLTELNYQRINDCIGALEGCKLELYRRIAADYENKKILENGDCY